MRVPVFPIIVYCPWCGRGETLADKTADINVSCQCPRCGKYYLIDFKTGHAIRAGPNICRKAKIPNRRASQKTE